jgi:hypothetical protein
MKLPRAFLVPIVLIVVVVVSLIGYQAYRKNQAPEAQKISSSLEGMETPPPVASPASSAVNASPAPADAKNTQSLSAPDLYKYGVLREIFETKNDNDPRFDTDLKNLSPELKLAFERRYAELAPEKRNERGTVAFLVAREISSAQDVEFLEKVLAEKTCLSLADCSKEAGGDSEEEKHLAGINEVTASYPQLTTIQQSLARYQQLAKDPKSDPGLKQAIYHLLEGAQDSPNGRVGDAARQALSTLKN